MSYTDLTADIYFNGAATSLSGRLFRPEILPCKGIIVYHPGTPTHPPYSATEGKFNVLAEALLPSGYAVLVPDYIGYGIHSGDAHPRYLYRPHAGLESFHLLKQVISDLRKEDVLEPTPDIRICGYSLGAYHAMGLLQRLEAIPELWRPTLFAGGGIFDLSSQFAQMLEHDRYDAPAYIVHLLGSLLGPQDTIACFAPIHQPSVAAFFKTHSKDLATLNETLPRELSALFDTEQLPSILPRIKKELQINSMEPPHVAAEKLTFYHARNDELCYLKNLETFLEAADLSVKIILGDAPSHGEGSKEYFGLLLETLGLEGC